MNDIIQIATADNLWLTQYDFFVRFLVAAGIGFVIGLERERSFLPQQIEIFAGVRTFTLVAMMGFLAAFLKFYLSIWIFEVTLFGLTAFTMVAYVLTYRNGHTGGTTEVALIVTYLLGGITLMGYIQLSLIVTVLMLIILSLKVEIKTLIGKITNDELYAFIKFVVIALLILPFLPNKSYGPYEVLNPSEIGWVVVLTSAIGFVGYILVKILGARKGILLTGILGGLVSSTAVTWNFSKKSHEMKGYTVHCAIAILAASSIMVVRVFIWLYLFNASLLPGMLVPLFLLLLCSVLLIAFWYRRLLRVEQPDTEVPLGNPLNLRDALFFGAVYGGILLLVSTANQYLGKSGIYIASGVAALSDIDAITISLAKLGNTGIDATTAQTAILLSTLSNTAVKAFISMWFGSAPLRRYMAWGYGLVFLTGLLGFLWLLLW
ncbi:MgtC/SapB family protein [Sphingobacteriales bacterium UPWRP_1]|nr:hypothetical protein B6N25_02995 [Sphingobacteriales bacterium TSM_CSS]PSJ76022.1 MgtC/SapB family protein [Sphingobacteriales bacterium UPWRP_1]